MYISSPFLPSHSHNCHCVPWNIQRDNKTEQKLGIFYNEGFSHIVPSPKLQQPKAMTTYCQMPLRTLRTQSHGKVLLHNSRVFIMHYMDSKYLNVITYLILSTILQGRYYHLSYKWIQNFETERMSIIPKLSKQIGKKKPRLAYRHYHCINPQD